MAVCVPAVFSAVSLGVCGMDVRPTLMKAPDGNRFSVDGAVPVTVALLYDPLRDQHSRDRTADRRRRLSAALSYLVADYGTDDTAYDTPEHGVGRSGRIPLFPIG